MQVLYTTTDIREHADAKLPVEQALPPDKLVRHSRVHVLKHQIQASLAANRIPAEAVAEVVCQPAHPDIQ